MVEAFLRSLNNRKVWGPQDLKKILAIVRPNFRFARSRELRYFNVPIAFDIETTSFYDADGKKTGIMYAWMLGIYGEVMMGRSWDDLINVLTELSTILNLNDNKRIIIYVHNLAFEFAFISTRFEWSKIFAIEDRKPIYAITTTGIEFRCSYLLSGYSLATLGKNLTTYKVKKKVGDLDYNLIRHSKTPLTRKETGYCVNDVKVVMAYIMERIEIDGNISKIPLTKTGYVRKYCRNQCFYTDGVPKKGDFKRKRYMDDIKRMTLTVEEYDQLKAAFQGGFTHANAWIVGLVEHGVTSFDFTSSYPFVLVSEQFPMSAGELVEDIRTEDDLIASGCLDTYCCLMDVEITGIVTVLWQENYLSQTRCWDVVKGQINNGRVVRADHLCTTITEQDYLIMKKFYRWDDFRILSFRRYKKDYLPRDFVLSILKLYQDKTRLKGVDGSEAEYQAAKEMVNSCYGMTVTDIVRELYIYTDHWLSKEEKPQVDKPTEINKYNNNPARFLFYAWGVWVTAYARRNLFSGILEFGPDYLYSDTDSIKVLHAEDHMEYINNYNALVRQQLYHAMDVQGIDHAEVEPETIEGKKKLLGVWDFDGHYSRFKTLGAKRYLVEYSKDPRNGKKQGKIMMTVAGLSKQNGVKYMLKRYKKRGIFDAFREGLYIPPESTGKMTHTYIDKPRSGVVTDYLGQENSYHELSGIHLEPVDYSLSIGREFSDYIRGVQTGDW